MSLFRVPFYPVIKVLLDVLSKSGIGLEWFDGAEQPEYINSLFKNQAEIKYGVFGLSDADVRQNKTKIFWDFWLDLEVYSNYQGRKDIAQTLQSLLGYFNSQEAVDALSAGLQAEGYLLTDLEVGKLHMGLPMYNDIGIWQNGSAPVKFLLEQVDESSSDAESDGNDGNEVNEA